MRLINFLASSEETDDKDLLEKFLLAVAKNLTVEMSLVKNTILAFESESNEEKEKSKTFWSLLFFLFVFFPFLLRKETEITLARERSALIAQSQSQGGTALS